MKGSNGSGGVLSVSSPPVASLLPPPFLSKTYDMVEDPSTNAVVSWSKGNNSFVVWNVPEFSRDLLPKYFKHNNFSSFVRQLNTYGFRKVDPDNWEFANEGFLRGHKNLLKNISRRKPSHAQGPQQPVQIQVQSTSVGSCVEVGKFGIEEEVERLKRDKNVLMQELVRLRQQQQSTDHQLQTVGQRVHVMEQRQQQMMSFLAKAMKSPGFVAQLVQQQNENNRHISGGNKKRRLHEENLAQNYGIPSPDGHIVKYQPLMNEAAKAMLRQILKMNAPGRLESKPSNLNGFLIDNVLPPSNVLDSDSSTNSTSGVTLSEVVPPLASTTEIQSSFGLAHGTAQDTMLPEANMTLTDFVRAQGSISEKNVDLLDVPIKGVESTDMGYMDTIPRFVDVPISVTSDEISPDADVDILLDDIHKLPGINDVFWEQFLSDSPFTGDTDEANSGSLDYGIGKDQKMEPEGEWEKMKQLSNLTEQMGLLVSASNNE